MTRFTGRFYRARTGAVAVEYALMGMCIVLAIVASVAGVGTQLNNLYAVVGSHF